MKIIISLLLLLSVFSAQASDCLIHYAKISDKKMQRNEFRHFGIIAGSAAAFVAIGGGPIGGAIVLGAFAFGKIKQGPSNTRFTKVNYILMAAQRQDYEDKEFRKFSKSINKELRKKGHSPVESPVLAEFLTEGNNSQAFCPEVVDEERAEVVNAVFDVSALKMVAVEFVLKKE